MQSIMNKESGQDWNKLITVPTGAGMSFLMDRIQAELASRGGAVLIIDKGQSFYREVAK